MNQLTLRKPSRPVLAQRWTECGRIAAIVAAEFGVDLQHVLSARRGKADVVLARHVAMYVVYRTTDLSFATIGRQFGRDHTAVIAGCNGITTRMAGSPAFRGRVTRCEDAAREPAAMAAEHAVQTSVEAVETEISALASSAFAIDPIGAAGAVADALRAFLAQRTGAANG